MAIEKIAFTANHLELVQGFDCGDEPWQTEVSDWIKGPVLQDMEGWGTEVWLYLSGDGQIIGFGSLGRTRWQWPTGTDRREFISIIPNVGIRREFWGQPPGNRDERYSSLIIDDLIAEAQDRQVDRLPVLGLFVHPANEQAKRLYLRKGFRPYSKRQWVEETRAWYDSMILTL